MKKKIFEISKKMSELGYRDVLFLEPKDAAKVMTPKRLEIIEAVKKGEIKSIRDLSRKLGRKENVVHQDLMILAEEGVINFRESGNAKIPMLRHQVVWSLPICIEEEVATTA